VIQPVWTKQKSEVVFHSTYLLHENSLRLSPNSSDQLWTYSELGLSDLLSLSLSPKFRLSPNEKIDFSFWLNFGLSPNFGLSKRLIQQVAKCCVRVSDKRSNL